MQLHKLTSDKDLVGTILYVGANDAEFAHIQNGDTGWMNLGCHGGVVIIGPFDLDFSFPVDVDPVQRHARRRHGHVPKFQETKSSFVVDVDRQNRIRVVVSVFVVLPFLFHPRKLNGVSKKVVEFLFVHVRGKVPNVQTPGVPCLLGHHGEVATRGNPGEIGGTGIGRHGDRSVLRQLLRCGRDVELGGTGLALAAAFVGPVLFFLVRTKDDDSQLFSAAAANSVVTGAVVGIVAVAVHVTIVVVAPIVVSVSISSTTVSVHISSMMHVVPTASSSCSAIIPIVRWSTAAAIVVVWSSSAAIVVTPPVVVSIAIIALWWKLMLIVGRWATATRTTSGATKGIAFEMWIASAVVDVVVSVWIISVCAARWWGKTRWWTIPSTNTASVPELILLTRHPCRSIRYSSSSTAHGTVVYWYVFVFECLLVSYSVSLDHTYGQAYS